MQKNVVVEPQLVVLRLLLGPQGGKRILVGLEDDDEFDFITTHRIEAEFLYSS